MDGAKPEYNAQSKEGKMDESLFNKLKGKHKSSIKIPEAAGKTINEIKPKPIRDVDDPLPFQPTIKSAPKPQVSEFVPYIKAKEKLNNIVQSRITAKEIKIHHYQSSSSSPAKKNDNDDDNQRKKREFNYWGKS